MRLKLEIDSENDALQDPKDLVQVVQEFASLLSKVAMHGELTDQCNGGNIKDLNGNTIGSWEFEP